MHHPDVHTALNSGHDGSYPLLPGEKILSITPHPPRYFPPNPSSNEQLLRLTRSNTIDEIGHAGPALASLAMASQRIEEPLTHAEYLHLYEAIFGRDSLQVGRVLVDIFPKLTRSTILALAELQGTTYNIEREEEPGRIVHEFRTEDDPMAKKLTENRGWHWPYYGSVDATPEFVKTLAAYVQAHRANHIFLNEKYTDRDGQERTILYAMEQALNWIDHRRAQNPEGLVEFKSQIPMGIENQVWKDSWDAYHHADGTIANHKKGIASLDVQVSTYDALLEAARIYEDTLEDPVKAKELRHKADTMRSAIFNYFWTEDKGGYFVIGTDRDDEGTLRQMKIRTSTMGHTLNSHLLEGDDPEIVRMRDGVIRNILSPELWCKAGIRTLASDEVRFRPGAYHNGSVWLWESHYIADGLRRHGLDEAANAIDMRLIKIANETGIFPEYVRGEQNEIKLNHQTVILWDEKAQRENVVEQPPQEVQAWTVAAVRASKHWVAKRELLKAQNSFD